MFTRGPPVVKRPEITTANISIIPVSVCLLSFQFGGAADLLNGPSHCTVDARPTLPIGGGEDEKPALEFLLNIDRIGRVSRGVSSLFRPWTSRTSDVRETGWSEKFHYATNMLNFTRLLRLPKSTQF